MTPEQLASGRGAHVDVEIGSKLLANGQIDTGSLLSNADQKAYLGTIKPFGKSQTTGYSDADIATFNSEKYNPQTDKDTKRVDRYNQYTNDRAVLQSDPNTSTLDLMRLSRGQKNLGQAENKAYKDINTVVSQLESLNKSITEYNKEGFFGGNEL